MTALLARLTSFCSTYVSWQTKPFAEPEPFNANPRDRVGFFNSLTPEQQSDALAYRGEESHGDPQFVRR